MTHKEYADGLRAAADFYENNTDIPVPHVNSVTNYSLDSKAEAAKVIKRLGACDKVYTESQLWITKQVAPGFELRFVFSRESVCERVVVGKKVVPAREEMYLPAAPEREEDIVEWQCGSILQDVQA